MIDYAFRRIRYDSTQLYATINPADMSHGRGEETSFEAANSSPIVDAADEDHIETVILAVPPQQRSIPNRTKNSSFGQRRRTLLLELPSITVVAFCRFAVLPSSATKSEKLSANGMSTKKEMSM
jgi:hypothetical protein